MTSTSPSWPDIGSTVADLTAQLEESISNGLVVGLQVSDIKQLTWHDAQRLISASSLPDGHPSSWPKQMTTQSRGDRAKNYATVLESIKDDLKIHRMDLASAWGESCDDAEEGMNLYLSGVREKFKDMKKKEGISQAAQNGFLELSLMWGQTADCISSLILLSQTLEGTTNSMIEAMRTATRKRTSNFWKSAMKAINIKKEALLRQSRIVDKDKLWNNASALSTGTRDLVKERYDEDRAFQAETRLLTEEGGLNAEHCTLGRLEEIRDWYQKQEDVLTATMSETSETKRQPNQPFSAITEAAKKLTEVGGEVASAWSRWARSLTGARSHKAVNDMSECQDQLFGKMAKVMEPVVPVPLAKSIIQKGHSISDLSAGCTDQEDGLDAPVQNASAGTDDEARAAEGDGIKADLTTETGTGTETDVEGISGRAFSTQEGGDGKGHKINERSDEGSVSVVTSPLGDDVPAGQPKHVNDDQRSTDVDAQRSVVHPPEDPRGESQASELDPDSASLSDTCVPPSPSVPERGREALDLDAEAEESLSAGKGNDLAPDVMCSSRPHTTPSQGGSDKSFEDELLEALLTQRSPGTMTPLADRTKIPFWDNRVSKVDPYILEQQMLEEQARAARGDNEDEWKTFA